MLRVVALAGAVIIAGSGCTSASSGRQAPGASVRPTSVADDKAITPEALCHALVTAQDLPPGYAATPASQPCDASDAELQVIRFDGLKGGSEKVVEHLVVGKSSADLKSKLPDNLQGFNLPIIGLSAVEQDSSQFRDLGDEVHYFSKSDKDWHQSTISIRRGKLLVFVGVIKDGPFTAADMRLFVSRALKRTESLG